MKCQSETSWNHTKFKTVLRKHTGAWIQDAIYWYFFVFFVLHCLHWTFFCVSLYHSVNSKDLLTTIYPASCSVFRLVFSSPMFYSLHLTSYSSLCHTSPLFSFFIPFIDHILKSKSVSPPHIYRHNHIYYRCQNIFKKKFSYTSTLKINII